MFIINAEYPAYYLRVIANPNLNGPYALSIMQIYDDLYENNDDPWTPTNISYGMYEDLMGLDSDWYNLTQKSCDNLIFMQTRLRDLSMWPCTMKI